MSVTNPKGTAMNLTIYKARGVYRRIKRLFKARTNQADKLDAMSVPELFQEAHDALWELEEENRDIDVVQPILAMDRVLKEQQAKWELSQRLSKTGADDV